MQIIASSNYCVVNKAVARDLGLEAAVMLGELASEYAYWEKRDGLEDGCFYSTIENIEEQTTLTRFQQNRAIDMLRENGLLESSVKGIPARRYFKFNYNQVCEYLTSKFARNLQTGLQETYKQDCEKPAGNNNKNNNKNNNNNNITVVTAKRFTPPTVEEVEAFCKEKGYGVNAQRFVDFYESKGWMIGKNKMTKWKSAVATWEHKDREQGKVGINGIRLKPDTGEPDILDGIL